MVWSVEVSTDLTLGFVMSDIVEVHLEPVHETIFRLPNILHAAAFTCEAVYDVGALAFVCLFVCGISLTSGQLIIELFPDCTRSCFSPVVSRRRGGDRIYEMRCLFVTVGLNARFIVLPHWDNMSQAHMLTHPVTLY